MSLLEKFYLDGIYPQEIDCIANDLEYQNECKNLGIFEEQLFENLDNNSKQIYESIKNAKTKILALEKASAFATGFRMGCNITFEVVKSSSPHQI